jgi:lipopolysaccharide biosynthesis regulator YciM
LSTTQLWWLVFPVILLVFILFVLWYSQRRRTKTPYPHNYIEALKAMASGDSEEAFERFMVVTDEDTNNADAYLRLGDLFREKRQFDKAVQVHQELTLRPGLSKEQEVEIKKSLALDFLEAKRYGKAIPALRGILELSSSDSWGLENLLRAYEETAQWDKALETKEKILKQTGTKDRSALALYQVFAGKRLAEEGDYHRARLAYKDALGYDDKCAAAYLYLGDAYMCDERPEGAIDHWKKLMAKAPQRAYLAFERLESTLFDLGKYGEIVEIYKRIIQGEPKNIRALYALAKIFEKMGKTDSAIEMYRKALQVDPNLVHIRQHLIRLYRQTDQVDLALAEIDRLIESVPERADSFTCQKCGYVTNEVLWKCPKCDSWDSFNL